MIDEICRCQEPPGYAPPSGAPAPSFHLLLACASSFRHRFSYFLGSRPYARRTQVISPIHHRSDGLNFEGNSFWGRLRDLFHVGVRFGRPKEGLLLDS